MLDRAPSVTASVYIPHEIKELRAQTQALGARVAAAAKASGVPILPSVSRLLAAGKGGGGREKSWDAATVAAKVKKQEAAREGGRGGKRGLGSKKIELDDLPRGLFEEETLAQAAAAVSQPLGGAKVEALIALEAVEARMREETSRELTVWTCLDCGTGKEHRVLPPTCSSAGHNLTKKLKTYHAFRCDACSYKTFYGGKMCAVQCPKCGKRAWTAASVYSVRDLCEDPMGGKVKPRGEEQINSLRYG